MKGKVWVVRPTPSADRDFANILTTTCAKFGVRQARIYEATLMHALRALRTGPDTLGAKQRDDLPEGVLLLHVARQGRKGRHYIVFRVADENTLDVLRILYDGMDLPAHLA
ncbi:MAG: type II toxin-antitoxin system RelE/ParE family toxin [Verrucomicrobiaceae bacterium]|nr:type II toxin-antitoxin system RelE/ParE family toxin [Verrucomicrobiaceae bacterium]